MKKINRFYMAAVACGLGSQALALEPMSNNQLSGVMARDGISVSIDLPSGGVSWDQVYYDRDGASTTNMTAGEAGALKISGLTLTTPDTITTDIDAGQSTGGDPVLNVNISLASGTKLHVGDMSLSVPKSNNPALADYWNLDAAKTETLLTADAGAGFDITLGATSLNLQLGNVAQQLTIGSTTYNPMLLGDLTIQNGLHITDFTLPDANSGAALTIGDVYVNNDTGSLGTTNNLTLKNVGMNVTTNGVAMIIGQPGDATNGINVQMNNIQLGNSSASTTFTLEGLQLSGGVLTLSGH